RFQVTSCARAGSVISMTTAQATDFARYFICRFFPVNTLAASGPVTIETALLLPPIDLPPIGASTRSCHGRGSRSARRLAVHPERLPHEHALGRCCGVDRA